MPYGDPLFWMWIVAGVLAGVVAGGLGARIVGAGSHRITVDGPIFPGNIG